MSASLASGGLSTLSESPIFSDTDEPHSYDYDEYASSQNPSAVQPLSPLAAGNSGDSHSLNPLQRLIAGPAPDRTPKLIINIGSSSSTASSSARSSKKRKYVAVAEAEAEAEDGDSTGWI
jgi:hypothetical protein